MAITHNFTLNWSGASGNGINALVSLSGTVEENVEQQIAAAAVNAPIAFAINHTALQDIELISDQAITVYVNAPGTGAPILTIALAANVPYIWFAGCGFANPFSAAITALYASNAGASNANLKIRALRS